jgi:hypothetical protein
MSMSAKLAMEAVNKSAIIQLDHSSARVIAGIVYHLVVSTVVVRWLAECMP